MHVRDEHVRNKETRARVKRRFETRTKLALQEAERNRTASRGPPSNLPQASTSGSSLAPNLTGSTTPSVPEHASTTSAQVDQTNNSDTDPSLQPSNPEDISTFRQLVEAEIDRANLDEDMEDILDEISVPAAPGTRGLSASRPKKITALFDFTTTYWAASFGHYATRTFDQELEIYELLDADAEGEVDVEIDETTAQVLVG